MAHSGKHKIQSIAQIRLIVITQNPLFYKRQSNSFSTLFLTFYFEDINRFKLIFGTMLVTSNPMPDALPVSDHQEAPAPGWHSGTTGPFRWLRSRDLLPSDGASPDRLA